MIIKTYKFSVGTMYVGSEVSEEVEIEFTEEEYNNNKKREDKIEEYYNEWMWQNIDSGWEEVED